MLFLDVHTHLFQLFTMHMDKLAALLALAVETHIAVLVTVFTHIFKTCGTVWVDNILVDDSLIDEFLELAVNGGLTDILALSPAVLADISRRDMYTRGLFEIVDHYLFLLGLVV